MNTTTGRYMIKIKEISANGMTFKCRVCGLENGGEPVILLHGFPETSHMWEKLMYKLAERGYRCLAPDQRGYSPGARPKGIRSYLLSSTASDVVALADKLDLKKFHLIGHDWGSACGWAAIELFPQRIQSWTSLSVPHMEAFSKALVRNPKQMIKSSYMLLFQLPIIPECLLSTGSYRILRGMWENSPPDEVEDYLNVFGSYDGRRGALNWYRANKINLRGEVPGIKFGYVSHPTLFIWGSNDPAVGRDAVETASRFMTGEYKFLELGEGHWLIQGAFERVRDEIIEHVQSHPIKN